MLKYCSKTVLLIALILQSSVIFALPPQFKAVNDFMAAKPLSRMPLGSCGIIDEDGTFHFFFIDWKGHLNRQFKYISFNTDGSVKTAEKSFYCSFIPSFGVFTSIMNKNGNSHLAFAERVYGYNSYTYLLIDRDGIIRKEIDLGPQGGLLPSDLNILSDGTVLINGRFNIPYNPDFFGVFYFIEPEKNDYNLIRIKPPLKKDFKSFGADLHYLNDGNYLLATVDYNYYTGELLLLKTIVDINNKIIVDYKKIPVHNSAHAYYSGLAPEINAGWPSFIDLGDTLAYWYRLPKSGSEAYKNSLPDQPMTDSICVILFDKMGNLLKRDSLIYTSIQQRDINDLSSRDILCRTNGYGYFIAHRNSWYSPYGILSFRNFPEIILDIEEWQDIVNRPSPWDAPRSRLNPDAQPQPR